MNRRTFIKGIIGTVAGISLIPQIPDFDVNQRIVRYKDHIFEISSMNHNYPDTKLIYMSTKIKGKEYCNGLLVDNEKYSIKEFREKCFDGMIMAEKRLLRRLNASAA